MKKTKKQNNSNNNYLIQVKNLSVTYGRTTALEDVTLDVKKGDYLGIIGPNGGGKSTLLKAILGLIPITSGKVVISACRDRKNHLGYVPQFSSVDRKFPISVFEVVLSGRLKGGISPFFRYTVNDRKAVSEIMERVGIKHLEKRQIFELSGGEFQKMLIARALAVYPNVLLLDEPTASVDAHSREQIYELLSELNKEMTIVLVTHDLMAISSQVNSLACLNGRLVYHGAPELSQNVVDSLYGCPVDLIAHGVAHRVLGKHNSEDCCHD